MNVKLSPDARAVWDEFVAEHGLELTNLAEAIARVLLSPPAKADDAWHSQCVDRIVRAARQIKAEKRASD